MWKYGKHNGYPCKGSKGEKEYRKYLKDGLKKDKERGRNPGSYIKMYKKQLKELEDFYKQQKKGGRRRKTKRKKRSYRK